VDRQDPQRCSPCPLSQRDVRHERDQAVVESASPTNAVLVAESTRNLVPVLHLRDRSSPERPGGTLSVKAMEHVGLESNVQTCDVHGRQGIRQEYAFDIQEDE
jgi:hypothetical protein